nr:hypothetical protein [uncultured Brevundimonas sp.]
MRLITLLAAAIVLAACGGRPSLTSMPLGAHPTVYLAMPRLMLQVDQNGDFYPDNWHDAPGDDDVGFHRSLALAYGAAAPGALARSREAALGLVREATAGKSRVFILIHGFNANSASAEAGYGILERTILFEPTDALIEFNWDGLVDRGEDLNGARIWFPATASSQVAGSRALRLVLSSLHDQQVIFITHSRGSSVVLSAVSDPSYDPDFTDGVRALGFPADFLTPAPLDVAGLRLRMDAVFLAPAIGNPDFWDPDCTGEKGCKVFRDFPGLDSVRHTRNPGDPILSKRIFSWNPFTLTCSLNATTLGYTEDCGSWVRDHYNTADRFWLRPFPMEPMKTHSFICYAGHPVLREMLAQLDVRTRPVPGRANRPPESCTQGRGRGPKGPSRRPRSGSSREAGRKRRRRRHREGLHSCSSPRLALAVPDDLADRRVADDADGVSRPVTGGVRGGVVHRPGRQPSGKGSPGRDQRSGRSPGSAPRRIGEDAGPRSRA